jgi:DNA-binding LytR/AlgR family response regulator
MSLATSTSLFLVWGLAALLVAIVYWALALTPFSVDPLTSTRSRPKRTPPIEQGGAEILLPVDKNGHRLRIAASEIFCVRANGPNSFLFDGRNDLFCPLSISEIDVLLPKSLFFRCHRSYIVNLAHVNRVKEVAGAGVVELDLPLRRAAPISHGRVAALRAELAAFRSGAMPPLREAAR